MLSYIISLLVVVFTVLGALFGLLRGFRKSVVRLISVICSALLAFVLSAPIARLFINEETVADVIYSLGISETYNELVAASPALGELIGAIPAAIIAPFIFIILFYLIKLIMLIPCAIVNTAMKIIKKESFKMKFVGIPIGALQGFISVMVPVIVIAGFIGMADKTIDVVLSDTSGAISDIQYSLDDVDEYIEEIKKDPIIGFLCGDSEIADSDTVSKDTNISVISKNNASKVNNGNIVFEGLTSFSFRGEKLYLTSEFVTVSEVFIQITPLMDGSSSEISAEDIDALERLTQKLCESKILIEIGTEVVAGACDKWSKGEEFIGISFAGIDKNIDPIIFTFFGAMKNSTTDTLREDMGSLISMLRIFDQHGLLNAPDGNTESLMKKLNGEMISDILTVLSENKRFSVVIPEVTNLSIKILASTLKLPENSQEVYDTVISDISNAINNSLSEEMTDESLEQFSNEIHNALASSGIEVTEEISAIVASSLKDTFVGYEGEITNETVQKYFEDFSLIYGAVEPDENNEASAEDDIVNISSKHTAKPESYYDTSTMTYEEKLQALALIGVLDHYNSSMSLSEISEESIVSGGITANGFTDYLINIYNNINKNYDTLKDAGIVMVTLKSVGDMNSNKVTVESLLLKPGEYTLTEEDIKNIGEGVDNILGFIESVESAGGDISFDNLENVDMESMGKGLDALKNTSLFEESIDPLAGALVSNVTGNSSANVTETLKNSNVSYESLMGTVKSTSGVIKNIYSDGADEENKNQSILTLLETITPENADVIIAIVDESFMIKQGINKDYAASSAKALKVALKEMALLPAEEHSSEVLKIRCVFEMISNSKNKVLYGENGIFKSADEMISMAVESKVAGAVLLELAFDENGNNVPDALGLASSINDSDKAHIATEMDNYVAEKKNTETPEEFQRISKLITASKSLILGMNK